MSKRTSKTSTIKYAASILALLGKRLFDEKIKQLKKKKGVRRPIKEKFQTKKKTPSVNEINTFLTTNPQVVDRVLKLSNDPNEAPAAVVERVIQSEEINPVRAFPEFFDPIPQSDIKVKKAPSTIKRRKPEPVTSTNGTLIKGLQDAENETLAQITPTVQLNPTTNISPAKKGKTIIVGKKRKLKPERTPPERTPPERTPPAGNPQDDINQQAQQGPRSISDTIREMITEFKISERDINNLVSRTSPPFRNSMRSLLRGTPDLSNIVDSLVVLGLTATVGVPPQITRNIIKFIRKIAEKQNVPIDKYLKMEDSEQHPSIRPSLENILELDIPNVGILLNSQALSSLSETRQNIMDNVINGSIPQSVLTLYDQVVSSRFFADTTTLSNINRPDASSLGERGIPTLQELFSGVGSGDFLLKSENDLTRVLNQMLESEGEDKIQNIERLINDYAKVLKASTLLIKAPPANLTNINLPVSTLAIHDRLRNININSKSEEEYNKAIQELQQKLQKSIISTNNTPEQTEFLMENMKQVMKNIQAGFGRKQIPVFKTPTIAEVKQQQALIKRTQRTTPQPLEVAERPVQQQLPISSLSTLGGFLGAGALAAGLGSLSSDIPATTGGIVGGLAGAVGSKIAPGVGIPAQIAITAASSAVGAGVGALVSEQPIIPPDVLEVEQQKGERARGTLRPKFITPASSLFQPGKAEYQADVDEWALFDYVVPSSEGAEGNITNNVLKQSNAVENAIQFTKAGFDVNAVFYKDDDKPFTKDEVRDMTLGVPLPLMKFEPQEYEQSRYEMISNKDGYDWNGDRTAVEVLSPYNSMTNVSHVNNESVEKSVLYGRVP